MRQKREEVGLIVSIFLERVCACDVIVIVIVGECECAFELFYNDLK